MSILSVFSDLEQLLRDGFTGVECVKRTLMIAMTPRTGSTHLCSAIEATGKVGRPTEIFNGRGSGGGPAGQESRARNVARFADLINSINAEPDPAFAFKTCWHDFRPFAAHWRQIFPQAYFLYLDRRGIFDQVVSLIRADLSNQFHREEAQEAGRINDQGLKFSMNWAEDKLNELEAEKRCWERFFIEQSVAPARLMYEDFEKDIRVALRLIENVMGIELYGDSRPARRYEKLADKTSEDLALRLRNHVLRVT